MVMAKKRKGAQKLVTYPLGVLVNVVFLLTRLIMIIIFILIRWLCYAATIQVTLHCRWHFLIWPASRVSSLSIRDFGLWRI